MNTYRGNEDGKKVPLSTLQAKSRISVLHCSVLALFKALLVSVDTLHLQLSSTIQYHYVRQYLSFCRHIALVVIIYNTISICQTISQFLQTHCTCSYHLQYNFIMLDNILVSVDTMHLQLSSTIQYHYVRQDLKGTVIVISSDPPFKTQNAQFTTTRLISLFFFFKKVLNSRKSL